MQVILPASENILKILGKPKISDDSYRLMCYAISTNVEDGVLLFNTLTRELLLLTGEEYEKADTLPELREKWFTVPQSLPDGQRVSVFLSERHEPAEAVASVYRP